MIENKRLQNTTWKMKNQFPMLVFFIDIDRNKK